jgi:hypothetical protein
MTWDTDAQGNIIVDQITGFHVAPAMGTAVVARIEFQRLSDQGEITSGAIQLAMSPQIARQLAADLERAGKHIVDLPRPDKSN